MIILRQTDREAGVATCEPANFSLGMCELLDGSVSMQTGEVSVQHVLQHWCTTQAILQCTYHLLMDNKLS